MSKRAFTGRRFSRAKKTFLWVTDLSTTTFAADGFTSFILCAGTDWERTTTSSEQATVRRVVGSMSCCYEDTTPLVGTQTVHALVAVADEDAPAVDPRVQSAYDDEKAMWTWQGLLRHGTTSADATMSLNETDAAAVDIGVNRRLNNGQGVELSIGVSTVNAGANGTRWSWTLRSLIQVG